VHDAALGKLGWCACLSRQASNRNRLSITAREVVWLLAMGGHRATPSSRLPGSSIATLESLAEYRLGGDRLDARMERRDLHLLE
jgi:hypothetical protein